MAVQVGQGIKDAMAQQQDHPIEDSTFTTNRDGSVVEKCLGTKGLYVASNASGQWETIGPFSVAA